MQLKCNICHIMIKHIFMNRKTIIFNMVQSQLFHDTFSDNLSSQHKRTTSLNSQIIDIFQQISIVRMTSEVFPRSRKKTHWGTSDYLPKLRNEFSKYWKQRSWISNREFLKYTSSQKLHLSMQFYMALDKFIICTWTRN